MLSVLIIDDDDALSMLVALSLRSETTEVDTAGSFRDGAAQLAAKSYHLVIIDGMLGDGSGIDLISDLRAHGRTEQIVFVSAFLRDPHTFRYLTDDFGVAIVAAKPLDIADLVRRVGRLLQAHERSQNVAEALQTLHATFSASLPLRIEVVQEAITAAVNDRATLPALRATAHTLRGTAGSYGHHDVGSAMAEVEEAAVAALVGSVATDDAFWSKLDAAMVRARHSGGFVAPTAVAEVFPPTDAAHTLLVVDSDPAFLAMVRSISRRSMVDIVTAETAAEALALARTTNLIGVLLDVHLGDRDSFALAHALRSVDSRRPLPLAFTSVDGSIETRVAAIEAGAARFLEKPIDESSLVKLAHGFVEMDATRPCRVLLVEPDEGERVRLSVGLREHGIVVEALAGCTALVETLDLRRPDLLLLSEQIPHISAAEICQALRASLRWELLPIIISVQSQQTSVRIRAYQAGAADVIPKDRSIEELRVRMQTQLARTQQLRDYADRDFLTRLLGRRAFLSSLGSALGQCDRHGSPLSIVMLDIDHFKAVNDTYGHEAGDDVIATIGSLLLRSFRVEDLRCRWGGEEFVVAFPEQGVTFAAGAAEQILRDIRALRFKVSDGRTFQITATAGVACLPADGDRIGMVLACADARPYAGKAAGRDRVCSTGASAPRKMVPVRRPST